MEREITASSLLPLAENILGLESPENFSCRVWKYRLSHSVMTIILRHDNATVYQLLYATFEPVLYFEGPMLGWKSANFCVAPMGECTQLLAKLRGITENIDFELPPDAGNKLFTVNSGNLQIKLLASVVLLSDKEPNF